MKLTVSCFLSFVLLSAAQATPELKGSPEELRQFLQPRQTTVDISASAEEKAYSDRAIVLVVVTTENKLLSQAIADNTALRESIAAQLIDSGVAEENINSSKFSTSPQYGWFGEKPKSYKVINRMSVAIDNDKLLQEIAGVADTREEISLAGTTFEHSLKTEFEAKVREQALAKIMAEKAFYEEQLGVTLTPLRFQDGSIYSRGARESVMLEEIVVTARTRSADFQDAPMSASAVMPETVSSFDEVEYATTVMVTFRVEPAG